MKKSLLFALAAVAMLGACNTADKTNKPGEATASDATEVRTVECVASGDVVYVHLDSVLNMSKLYVTEGTALQNKVKIFQEKAATTQQSWAKKEQDLANEYNKLQNEAVKLQQDYEKGLITTLNAQKKGEELAQKEQSIQSRLNTLQTAAQKESEELAKEEQTLAEEQMVVMNRFNVLVEKAIKEINADKRYKMIIDGMTVIDADPALNISSLLLKKVDELYEAGTLE
ncbi:MAG: OmpH family outer membrane protein [Alistipes sp.]|nr:OmpH family outer membrane protein [Alistipes sp.]